MSSKIIILMGVSDNGKSTLVIAVFSDVSIMSHVNDSGFWLVGKYLGLTEKQTFKSWTVMTTILALTSFTIITILSLLV